MKEEEEREKEEKERREERERGRSQLGGGQAAEAGGPGSGAEQNNMEETTLLSPNAREGRVGEILARQHGHEVLNEK